MELYYNPEQMGEAEIKQTFVGRQWLVDEMTALIKRQPKGAGLQHVLLIGPRGMGKTTMLLMLRFAVLETDLGRKWQPVRFPEESYGINDLADFWMAALANLSYEVSQPALLETVDKLKAEYKDAGDLAGAAHAALKDWSRHAKRRLILLVDNLDMILDQIGRGEDTAELRNVLMNDGTVMLVGTATSFFKQARNYDQALYNFFRPFSLDSLGSDQVDELLRQRASVERIENFEARLQENRTRIKVLHYFTGGNPRLILMLYRIIVSSEFIEVRRALEKLLDEVTPYYKAKIEVLPAQQRKILDTIARISGRTGEGLTPTQIAQETRLTVNQTSAQLKRLSDLGYVRAANVRGRNSYYSLAEPLYAIWHQMRFSRESRNRMEWLIEFLKSWYSQRELVQETDRLANLFRRFFTSGMTGPARRTLEARRHLSAAMDLIPKTEAIDCLICDCLDDGDQQQAAELLQDTEPFMLQESTRIRLRECGLLTADEFSAAAHRVAAVIPLPHGLEELVTTGRWADVVSKLAIGKSYFDTFPALRLLRARALFEIGDFAAAINDCDELLMGGHEPEPTCMIKALSLSYLERLDDAAKLVDMLPPGEYRAAADDHLGTARRWPEALFAKCLSRGWNQTATDCWTRHIDDPTVRHHLISAAAVFATAENACLLKSLVKAGRPYPEFKLLGPVIEFVESGNRTEIERLSVELRAAVEQLLAAREMFAGTTPN